MVSVKSFMIPKEKFVTVERDTNAQTAARIMRDRGIGSLFVTNGKEIIGILTDTDMVRRVVARFSQECAELSVRDLVLFLTNLPRK